MSRSRLTEIPVVFYRTAGGAEPVIEWLRGLPLEDRRTIGVDQPCVDRRDGAAKRRVTDPLLALKSRETLQFVYPRHKSPMT